MAESANAVGWERVGQVRGTISIVVPEAVQKPCIPAPPAKAEALRYAQDDN
jgi:hypothetical protein